MVLIYLKEYFRSWTGIIWLRIGDKLRVMLKKVINFQGLQNMTS